MTNHTIDNEVQITTNEPTTVQKLRALPWSVAFDIANGFFVQFSFLGSVFVLFLNDLGLNKSQIGFLLSLFPFFGLVSLFVAPRVASFGYKRTFITFYGLRNVFAAGLLLIPLLAAHLDFSIVLLYLAAVTLGFSFSRSTAMTALLPWQQEYIPNEIRGKYTAYSNIAISLAGLLAVSAAGAIIGQDPQLERYLLLFGLGVVFGLASIYLASFIPGGAPAPVSLNLRGLVQEMLGPIRDRPFLLYLLGVGLFTLATGPMFSFLPLFMQERVGLTSGSVVLLQNGTLLGNLLSSYLWGWMADRYGSKPVMLYGLFLTITLPVLWLVMPRQSELSLYVALGIALLQGIAAMGWTIGSGRLLFVSIVPPERNSSYMAQYNAWIGLLGGLSQVLGGWLLDSLSGVRGEVWGLEIESYTILLGAGFVLPLIGSLILRAIQTEREISVGEFAGLFLQGNPFLAVESIIRYHYAKDEPAAITVTERLGQARSPLTVDELLEALADPRFYVRFEAVVSIARRRPDARLQEALVETLHGKDPALSVIAAWALGRIGDPGAAEPLRNCLEAPYRSIKAHAARSLATLGDGDSIPVLLTQIKKEQDAGLRVAYASALGKLQATEAVGEILALLRDEENPTTQQELALATARLVGDESGFIALLRRLRSDPGTALSQAVSLAQRRLGGSNELEDQLKDQFDNCAEILARGDLDGGAHQMAALIHQLPLETYCGYCRQILQECAQQMDANGSCRLEYLALAPFIIERGLA